MMLSRRQLRTVASLITTCSSTYILISSPKIREAVLQAFSYKAHPLRLLALLSAILLNAKSLPLMWHVRFFYTLLYQLYYQTKPLPKDALFQPVVMTGMYTSLQECDHNMHKSNSTYFIDLDMGRTLLLSHLLKKGFKQAAADAKRRDKPSETGTTFADTSTTNNEPANKGRYMMALGGISCNFKREIKPYERFEIWTRVLSWDEKWIYLISHVVRAGSTTPKEWARQPLVDKRHVKKTGGSEPLSKDAGDEETRAQWQKAIFATSLAKYVVKKGRVTVPPEIVFQASGVLPPQPVDSAQSSQENVSTEDKQWTWEQVETERLRGLKLAQGFGATDDLLAEFPMPAIAMENMAEGSANGAANGKADAGSQHVVPLMTQTAKNLKGLYNFRDFGFTI